ncbi:UNVERIFIED_CONTAM: hypothetical protein DES50_12310 [Williamsia faeni]
MRNSSFVRKDESRSLVQSWRPRTAEVPQVPVQAVQRSRRRTTNATLATTVVLAILSIGITPVDAEPLQSDKCPLLHVLAVSGTTESSSDIDPNLDTGLLSRVTIGAGSGAVPGTYSRQYVPYPASFGGATPGEDATYEQSVKTGEANASKMLEEFANRCPDTDFALTGYSQGAQIARLVAQAIGAGSGPVPADRIAGVALFSDPGRAAGSPNFPGGPTDQTTPDPAPGTSGTNVAQLSVTATPPAEGGGIAPSDGKTFGELDGRVYSPCATGDMACSTPENAPIARLVTNIAGQMHLDAEDPQTILADAAVAIGGTVIRSSSNFINDGGVDKFLAGEPVNAEKSLLTYAAEGSDPTAPADPFSALVRLGTIGFGAAVTVAKKVITPANVVSLASVGLANPAAALALFGSQLVGAVADTYPPDRILNGVQQSIFNEVKAGVTDNAGLVKMATDLRYWDTVRLHGIYSSNVATPDGAPSTAFVAQWFNAVLQDLLAKKTETDETSERSDDQVPTTPGLPGLIEPTYAPATTPTPTPSPEFSPSPPASTTTSTPHEVSASGSSTTTPTQTSTATETETVR